MNVGEVCNREVVVIEKGATVLEAARRMRSEHVGDLVVVTRTDRRRPVGIVTDRDLVVGVMAMDYPHGRALLVGDVMSAELVTAREDEPLEDAIGRMRVHGVRRVPVVNAEGTLEGLLTLDDLLDLLVGELGQLTRVMPRQRQQERELRR
jgi:CBS domain-containing protein